MIPIKRELQYRRFIRDAEGIRDKNCLYKEYARGAKNKGREYETDFSVYMDRGT